MGFLDFIFGLFVDTRDDVAFEGKGGRNCCLRCKYMMEYEGNYYCKAYRASYYKDEEGLVESSDGDKKLPYSSSTQLWERIHCKAIEGSPEKVKFKSKF